MRKVCALLWLAIILTGCASGIQDTKPSTEETMSVSAVTVVPETTQAETILPESIQTEPAQPETIPTQPALPESEDAFVRVLDYIPTASQELRYATEDNFTGQVIYDFEDAYLRWGTVKKLQLVCRDLEELGLYMKIWDGFRPVSAQFTLWEVCPNPTYVANPNNGYSSHSRGNTIDLTLVDAEGEEVEMPTAFDDFSSLADRNYTDCTELAANNAQLLEILMEKHGFSGYYGEWWHYSDTREYPVEHEFEP